MNKLDAVIVICSTPRSRRIPKKCFHKINGKPALTHILDRIQNSGLETILAIPKECTESEENQYLSLLNGRGVYFAKGSTLSPLLRTYEALIQYKITNRQGNFPKYIVRVTHDDILIDLKTMLEMVKTAVMQDLDYVYCSNIIGGAGVEVIKTENLIAKAKEIDYPVEHISYFVKYGKILNYEAKQSISRDYNLTMDYPEDVVILEQVLRTLGNEAPLNLICAYLDSNKHILGYNKKPLLTIYTSCYNAEKYIEDCIISVLLAKKICPKLIEYILIDDCSTDKSLYNIINNIMLFDKDIKLIINQDNLGLSSCCNIALEQSKGKYIMRLDADDKLNAVNLETYLNFMEANDFAVVYPDYDLTDSNGMVIGNEIGQTNHHAGGALMNKRIINEIKFTEGLKHWDSVDLYNRVSKNNNFRISYFGLPMFSYRQHNESLSHNEEYKGIRKKVLEIINGKIL